MSRNLAQDLYHLMRGASRTASLGSLRRKGHNRVPVLRFRDVEALIERAVENTLGRLGIDLTEDDLAGLSDDARLEFLALIRERDTLKQTVEGLLAQQGELEQHQVTIRDRLAAAKDELAREAADETPGDDLDTLRVRLGERLTELLSRDGIPEGVAEKAVAMVDKAVREQRELAAERARSEHAGRLELLQRRIDKLSRKLGETEAMLSKARAASGAELYDVDEEDMGPAGLASADPQFEQKKAVLEEIFRLNVELRSMMAEEGNG